MIDWIFPFVFTAICVIAMLIPSEEDREDAERERSFREVETLRNREEIEATEELGYDAFRRLDKEALATLPPELKEKVPDKCAFCRWMLICDPLEMALATGKPCAGFEER